MLFFWKQRERESLIFGGCCFFGSKRERIADFLEANEILSRSSRSGRRFHHTAQCSRCRLLGALHARPFLRRSYRTSSRAAYPFARRARKSLRVACPAAPSPPHSSPSAPHCFVAAAASPAQSPPSAPRCHALPRS